MAGPHRAARPGPGADRPQRRTSAAGTAGTRTWPGVTGCWAAWPWPPGTPPRPGSTWPRRPRCFRDGDYLTELARPWPTSPSTPGRPGTWTPPGATRPRRSPSPPPAAWCPPSAPRWPPAPASAPARPPPPPARTCWTRAATPPTPRCGSPSGTSLAWHELDALRAHAALDQAEGIDRGWAAQADALHARLVPPGLDPDPLATVERNRAWQQAAQGVTAEWYVQAFDRYAQSVGRSLPVATRDGPEGIANQTLDLSDMSDIVVAAAETIAARWRERPPGLAAVIGLSPPGRSRSTWSSRGRTRWSWAPTAPARLSSSGR